MSDEEAQKQEQKRARGTCECCCSIILFIIAVSFLLNINSFIHTEKNDLQNELEQKYGLSSAGSIRHDKTGKWKLNRYASSTSPEEFIIDYYKAFFNSDDEVHWIINYTFNTTTCVHCNNGILKIDIYERVPDEEFDASTIGSGMLYATYYADTNTGEIKKTY